MTRWASKGIPSLGSFSSRNDAPKIRDTSCSSYGRTTDTRSVRSSSPAAPRSSWPAAQLAAQFPLPRAAWAWAGELCRTHGTCASHRGPCQRGARAPRRDGGEGPATGEEEDPWSRIQRTRPGRETSRDGRPGRHGARSQNGSDVKTNTRCLHGFRRVDSNPIGTKWTYSGREERTTTWTACQTSVRWTFSSYFVFTRPPPGT